MSFHEKSAWACLIAVLLVFVPYFALVLRYPMAFVALFVLAVFVLVALLAGFHIFNSLLTPSIRETGDTPQHDELDRLIELRAAKLSGLVLGIAVLLWSIAAMFGAPAAGVSEFVKAQAENALVAPTQLVVPLSFALTAIHLLFASFVAANVIYYGTIIAGYRRLADG